jgi:hypothetical protein
MVDNGVRFGALCSASKTFFVFFEGQGDEIGLVQITEAYITAQRNFLKAWASFVQEARSPTYNQQNKKFLLQKDRWIEVTPIQEDDQKEGCQVEIESGSDGGPDHHHQDRSNKPDGSGGGGGVGGGDSAGGRGSASGSRKRSGTGESGGHGSQGQSQKKRPHGADEAETVSDDPPLTDSSPESVGPAEAIPRLFRFNVERYNFEEGFVEFYDPPDFEIGTVLGRGRNGDVFSSKFQGEDVAVKQFDLSKNFDSYQREVEGYKFLRKAWGALVPVPKFIGASRSGMVRFLGLQKGTKPDDDNDDIDFEFHQALVKLRKLHHFRHLDSSNGRNAVYVGENSTRKLLVVDLESWEDTRTRVTGDPAASTPRH